MKRLFPIPVLLLVLTLSACGPGTKLGELISTATTTITNPVDAVDIYRAKNVYAASLDLAVAWRNYCWSKPYAVLIADPVARPICQNRRSVVRSIQVAQPKAASALSDAQIFVLNHPTLNATDVITAAWAAVTNFKNAIPAK